MNRNSHQEIISALFLSLCLLAAPHNIIAATIHIEGGTFTIIPVHGDSIEVSKITIEQDDTDLLFFTEANGQEGFIHRTNIRNINELLGLVTSDGSAEDTQRRMKAGREKDRINQQTMARNLEQKKAMESLRYPAPQQQYSTPKATRGVIESDCKKKWGTNYEMVEYCIKNQRQAVNNLSRHSGPILQECGRKWGTNYEMVEYCTKNQQQAQRNLSRLSGPILQECRKKWGTNYEMVEYCTKNQTEAKRRLGY